MCLRAPQARRTSQHARSVTEHDPAPLSLRQTLVLIRAVWRELSWGLPAVQREVRRWRLLAREIPAQTIRRDALSALDHKRGHIDGAALFSILPAARSHSLLRLLVAYEIIWDFLDCVNERGAQAGQSNGSQLHLALIDALDTTRPPADYYRLHPWQDDGGYLARLVQSCRESSGELPSFARLRPALVREAERAQVLAINHEPRAPIRDAGLRAWAKREFPTAHDTYWFELTGAASASLTVHALFALAAQQSVTDTEISAVRNSYFPWISAATTMLDSYVDQAEDAANSDHSYIAHYHTPFQANTRIEELIRRSLNGAATLPAGERHALIVACMIAMYLSKESARHPHLRSTTADFVHTGGALTRLLLPILRLWRLIYSQRST